MEIAVVTGEAGSAGTAPVPPRHVDVSIVVPLYDEEDNVGPLHRAVCDALAGCGWRWELVFVDDGSADDTLARARDIALEDHRVRLVALRRNFGQTAAMAAGIHSARGRTIVTMDGDLQNDPRDIPRLVALLDEGFDLATGWRRKRQDGGLRVFISRIANRIMNLVMGVPVRDSGCSLKAYRAGLIKALPFYGEMHRFIPALGQIVGSRTVQIEVRHHPRRFGKSKYGFSRIYKVMLDIISIRFVIGYARHPVAALGLPAAAMLAIGSALLTEHLVDPRGSMVFASAAVLFFVSAGFLLCLSFAGLILFATDPRMAEFARVAADMWRDDAAPTGREER